MLEGQRPEPPGMGLGEWALPEAILTGPEGFTQQLIRFAKVLQWAEEAAVQGQPHGLEVGPGVVDGNGKGRAIAGVQPHALSTNAPTAKFGGIGCETVEVAVGEGHTDWVLRLRVVGSVWPA